ncbi:hypothetical protein DPMN_172512 [Dreissena polymorpha]|uniref:Uncharacterized protein n=1 Tax=Dreissena polymorpha TaxID=45954 RepID=A0A9D4E007_DREPO|nr:hypothetical protein DPMN_172512 [Dreissena polymorpha]
MYCEPSRTARNVNVKAIMVKAIMLKQYCICYGEKYSDTVVSNKIDNAVVSDVLRDKTYCKRTAEQKTYCETTYCATYYKYYKVKAIMQCPWRDVLRAMSMEPYCWTIFPWKDALQDSSIRMDVMRAMAMERRQSDNVMSMEDCKARSIIRDVLRGRSYNDTAMSMERRTARQRAYCETLIYGQSDNVMSMEDVLCASYNKKVVVYG